MGVARKNLVTDSQILESYETLKSAFAVARTLGVGATTVYRVLEKHGVDRVGREKYLAEVTLFSEEQAHKIRARYENDGAMIKTLITEFGGSYYSIKKAIKDAGGELKLFPSSEITEWELSEIRRLNLAGYSQMKIALEINRSQTFVRRAMVNNGIIDHSHKGNGRYMTGNGYWRVFISKDDQMASMRNNSGHVLEHRLVMARKLGRPLSPTETVHHIDGDEGNNDPDNLQLRQGRHGKHTVMACGDCGSHNIVSTRIAEHQPLPSYPASCGFQQIAACCRDFRL